MKLGTSKLVIITLPLLPLSSYAHINIDNLKHQCENLKPGTEYVIQMTQKEIDKQFKKVILDAGCNVKLEKKNGKTIVAIVKQPKESDNDLLAGLDDLGTGPVEEPDWMKRKEQQVAQKEQQVAQKEQQVAQKEQQVAELEKMVKAKGYLGYLQDKTIKILENVKNKNIINNILDEILKTLKIGNLKGNEYGEQIAKGLKLVRTYYKGESEDIVKKINILLYKLNLD